MSYNNNSRNVANLLRFQPLEPIKVNNQQKINPLNPPITRQRSQQQIPFHDVFTPDDNIAQKRNSRRIAPLSSQGINRNNDDITKLPRRNDLQFQSLKIRLDQIVKYYDQRNTNLQTKLMLRLNELQNFVMKQVPRVDNSIMLSSDIVGFKQGLKQVRKQMEFQLNEINTLKILTREKSDRQSSLIVQSTKDKQKMTVLFMQLVRLGDTIEKLTDQASLSTKNYQTRLQQLQQKLANSEKNISIISQRTASGSDVLNQFGDKLMTRLQSAQSNLLLLGKQQIKQKQLMSAITSQNQRIGQDINIMIMNMQTDFQNKLQNRMNQTLNRLMSQHEERIRHQQEIRKNLDIMERIQLEKQQSDKLENHARLNDMDVAVRNQFLKKQQSIRTLQMTMQQQFRTLINELQAEGGRRKQQQSVFRYQLKKVQQGFRKQYDLYKNHQSELIDKMTDLIKSQIQSRTLQQQDLKRITGQVGKMIADDLNNLKQAVSVSNKKLNLSIKEVSTQSSQRAGQLSHYIDNQVKKVVDVVTEKYSKMKTVFTKLAEQFKNHLLNTQTNRKNHESRLLAVEQDFQKLKSQVNQQIDQFYNDLQARLKQQKQFVETVVFKKTNQLTVRVNKLQEYTNQYFQVLKNGIQDNKQLLTRNMRNTSSNKNDDHNDDEIKQLRLIIFEMKKITEEIKTDHNNAYKKLDKEINSLEEKTKQTIVELTTSLNNKIVKNNDKTSDIEQKLTELTVKVNSLRAESGSETAISTDRVKKLTDQINQVKQKTKLLEQTINNNNNKIDQQIIKINSNITVLKGEVGALDDDIKKLSVASRK